MSKCDRAALQCANVRACTHVRPPYTCDRLWRRALRKATNRWPNARNLSAERLRSFRSLFPADLDSTLSPMPSLTRACGALSEGACTGRDAVQSSTHSLRKDRGSRQERSCGGQDRYHAHLPESPGELIRRELVSPGHERKARVGTACVLLVCYTVEAAQAAAR